MSTKIQFYCIDGRYAGQVIHNRPNMYYHVMSFDNHPDIIACHPEHNRAYFQSLVKEALMSYFDGDEECVHSQMTPFKEGYATVAVAEVIATLADVSKRITQLLQEPSK